MSKSRKGTKYRNDTVGEVDSANGRSAAAKAADWVSRIMTISLGMVLPGLVGYWIDLQLGTKVLFLLLGFALGSFIAGKQLLAIANPKPKKDVPQKVPPKNHE
jgi:F0F1-type ATP synthase assembly protein I